MMVADRVPVLVGIGVATQRQDDPARAMDPLALMLQAVRMAGQDAGAAGLLPALDRILVPKGRWNHADPARSIAAAIGAARGGTVLSTVGVLQQTLIGMACAAIAEGDIEAAMVVGGDTGYRILRSQITGYEPTAPDEPGGAPDVLLSPKEELRHPAELRAGLRMPVGLYAIMESAFRARRGWSVDAHRDRIAAIYSRFSAIAADNPAAWTRKAMPPEAIRSASDRNAMQAFPYTKLMCSSWNVDQAAALLFCSARKAAALGIDRDRWIFPWASTESNHMVPVSARAELDACPGAGIAGRAALEPFGIVPADIDLIDLYSCFPLAVEVYAAELGIDPGRDLTVTGGMSFAGGPYNNYVLQSTARMGQLLREAGKGTGLVSSVSGALTKQGFCLWSVNPAPDGFRFVDTTALVAQSSAVKPVVMDFVGPGRIAGYTVVYERSRPPRAVVVADLEDGLRSVATSDDPGIIARLQAQEFCGAPIVLNRETFALATGSGLV
jgi:acetyl-CoA C-acetyltransferase